jgi:uncharacterized protein (DUF488 family)
MTNVFFTVGHSSRSVPEFVNLLQSAGIEQIADVRSFPRSRAHPHFNLEQLPFALAEARIGYEHIAALGGRRRKQQQSAQYPNNFWENVSFRNYADYAMTDCFLLGLKQLRALGSARRTAMMCAEALWWQCHRRIIADYLLAADDQVVHLLGRGRSEPAKLTPSAQIIEGRRLLYRKHS